MSSALPASDTMFLLGAGASIPAGLPGIDEMTEEFKKTFLIAKDSEPFLFEQLKDDFQKLERATTAQYGKADLEYLMTIIIHLLDNQYRELFIAKYPELKDLEEEWLGNLRRVITSFIRERLEEVNGGNVHYLWPLQGFVKPDRRLQIFTLNYDATVEMVCEIAGIPFSDGFHPNWNPTNFQSHVVNIYKLHGSLYWLRTDSGKIIKVPIKRIDVDDVRYLTDESVTEMMIYPALQKSKHSEVYSWLSQKFIESLLASRTCIILGYSFRDEDVRKIIVDAMYRNPDLWLIIVSRSASEKKRQFFSGEVSIASRVYAFDSDMVNAVGDRKLMDLWREILTARAREAEAFRTQAMTSQFDTYRWEEVFGSYLDIGHHDKAFQIARQLLEEKFTSWGPNDTPERIIGHKALQYILVFGREPGFDLKRWRELFEGYFATAEYDLLHRHSLLSKIPMNPDALPKWANKGDFGGVSLFSRYDLVKELESVKPLTKDSGILKGINMMIETIRVLEKGDHSTLHMRYFADDLGIMKWAKRVGELLTKSVSSS